MSDSIIEIRNLHKHYGDIHAVDGIDFDVKRGELFAFLGLNGAGKSTTINIICGLVKKDGGEIRIDGEDIGKSDAYRKKLGIVFQNSVLDSALTVRDNLLCRASLYGISKKEFAARLNELDALLDISPLLKRTVGNLSGGQRRRIDIARALIHKPSVLILDEPTTGLDPQTRRQVWNAIETLRRESRITVFLTTHYMEEATDADRVIILDSGKIAAEGTPLQLKKAYAGDFLTVYGISEAEAASLKLPCLAVPDGFKIKIGGAAEAKELILSHPNLFTDFELVKGKMDDVFLAVTGKNLHGNSEEEV